MRQTGAFFFFSVFYKKEKYDMIYLNAVPELDFYYKRFGFNELQIGGGYYVWMRNPK